MSAPCTHLAASEQHMIIDISSVSPNPIRNQSPWTNIPRRNVAISFARLTGPRTIIVFPGNFQPDRTIECQSQVKTQPRHTKSARESRLDDSKFPVSAYRLAPNEFLRLIQLRHSHQDPDLILVSLTRSSPSLVLTSSRSSLSTRPRLTQPFVQPMD